MIDIQNSFANTMKELEEEMERVQEKRKGIMTDAFQKLFVNIPELHTMQWEQATPHFNDGDECFFSVHEPKFIARPDLDTFLWEDTEDLDTALDNADYEYNSFQKPWCYGKTDSNYAIEETKSYDMMVSKVTEARMEEINKVLGTFYMLMQTCEDALKAAYGDHARVTISRSDNSTELSVEVEEYYHD